MEICSTINWYQILVILNDFFQNLSLLTESDYHGYYPEN
jgi:hypothetical protein